MQWPALNEWQMTLTEAVPEATAWDRKTLHDAGPV